jgi:tetratricopeptide (TPR) repeat protein
MTQNKIISSLVLLAFLLVFPPVHAEVASPPDTATKIDSLNKPLYTPFIERYVLDELKQLRIDLAAQKNALLQQIVDREHSSVDRGVAYATSTVTYFFYLIAAATSILVLVGWTSIRDIKERVQSLADEKVSSLINEYEIRLEAIEQQLNQKTKHIEETREVVDLAQEVQSLWLRAGQEANLNNKITIYDRILKLRNEDPEALTYKADAALELGEPQWAANLCHQVLEIDSNNSHAFYQLACAYAALGQPDEAVRFLAEAVQRTESYRNDLMNDPALESLHGLASFKELLPDD